MNDNYVNSVQPPSVISTLSVIITESDTFHANACTGHNFVTNTPIKFIFAIAIEVPDYKNPMIFGINRKNKMASGGHLV